MNIIGVTGIRSDYDILYPVLIELKKKNNVNLIVSGAHLSENHGKTINLIKKDKIKIINQIHSLLSTDDLVQRPLNISILINNLTNFFNISKPDLIMVVGDREESIASALVANYMSIPIAHIGGGDPVFGNSDDPIRFAVSKLSSIHLCSNKFYYNNLVKLGEDKFRIFNVGNPIYTSISTVKKLSRDNLFKFLKIKIGKKFLVLIKHPLSSEVDNSSIQMKKTLDAISDFCNKFNFYCICISPNTDPGSKKIKDEIQKFKNDKNILFYETLPRNIFVNLIRNSEVLVGNSSMGILEAPFYKLPVVNIGNRQMGRLNAGNVEITNYNKNNIISKIKKACFDLKYRNNIKNLINPFGNEKSAMKISKIINNLDIKKNFSKWITKKNLI